MAELRYPDLDPAKYGQLRSYLFQLIDELQYALNGLETSVADVKKSGNGDKQGISEEVMSSINKSKLFVKQTADTVIESDSFAVTDGVWYYKKWRGGTYEMFGSLTVTPLGYHKYGAMYYSDPIEIALPFAVTSAHISGTTTQQKMLSECVLSQIDNTISVTLVSDYADQTPCEVALTVMGHYKTEEDK